jgi:hypothetical protein
MKILNKALDEKKYDVRMMHKNLQRNVIQYEDVKNHQQNLPDDSSQVDYTKLEGNSEVDSSLN